MKRLTNHIALAIASEKFGRTLGPPARHFVLQCSGEPSVFRWLWMCGCSFDVVDDAETSVHWQHCANHTSVNGA
ncbi:MAG: hypothetical protein ABSB70_11325 [Candidatus Velthaea sp.]